MADRLLNTRAVTEQVQEELAKARLIRIAVPFVTQPGIKLLTEEIRQHPRRGCHIQLLTRFDVDSILAGVCDLEALQSLLAAKTKAVRVEIKCLEKLHAKYFIFDDRAVPVGSSNMTQAAQSTNVEVGFLTTGRSSVQSAQAEFDYCWASASPVDGAWINEQAQLLAPFRERYSKLRSEMRNLTVLQSIKMPNCGGDFLKSMRRILKKAGSAEGMSQDWLKKKMTAATPDPAEDEPKLNVDKRIAFLRLLGLVHDEKGALHLTPFGKDCQTDNKKLLARMVAVYPILLRSFQAIPEPREYTYKEIASVDRDPRRLDDASQTLRDTIHWLAAFGLVEQNVGVTPHKFQRKKSVLSELVSPPLI